MGYMGILLKHTRNHILSTGELSEQAPSFLGVLRFHFRIRIDVASNLWFFGIEKPFAFKVASNPLLATTCCFESVVRLLLPESITPSIWRNFTFKALRHRFILEASHFVFSGLKFFQELSVGPCWRRLKRHPDTESRHP